MTKDDPFANYVDDDKTVLKPTPGRKQAVEPPPQVSSPVSTGDTSTAAVSLNMQTTHNPLINNAVSLLSLMAQIRNSTGHADVGGLRNAVISEIKQFDQRSLQQGCPQDQVQTARYALCSFIDEIVLNTPWGSNSIWSTQGMLISFHKEAWGGEKFFQVLDKIVAQPGTYFNLLEFFYSCLSLGFEGKYKIQEQGQNKLYDIRQNVYQILHRQKGDFDPELSLHWQGITDKRNPLVKFVPLWVFGVIGTALLTLIYVGFLYAISFNAGDATAKQYVISDGLNVNKLIQPKPVVIPSITPAVPELTEIEKVTQFLQPEIDQKLVAVIDQNGTGIIRVLAKDFFASGSNLISKKYLPLVNKISQALELVDGQISVVGHTDNIPIFTVKYPSNWVLSQARAESVSKIILQNERFKNRVVSEGRADTQSLVPNDTAEHRAMNRRVEIVF